MLSIGLYRNNNFYNLFIQFVLINVKANHFRFSIIVGNKWSIRCVDCVFLNTVHSTNGIEIILFYFLNTIVNRN